MCLIGIVSLLLVAATSATSYTWNTAACNGAQQAPNVASCFVPTGVPTLADTVTFQAGTHVNFNAYVQNGTYDTLFAENVVIAEGAEVTFFNGIIAVAQDVHVVTCSH